MALTGPANHMWRGDDAKYAALHLRVAAKRGTPDRCEHCGSTTAKRYEWANLTGRYEDVSDYVRLCVSCHRCMDGTVSNLGRYAERGARFERIKRSPPKGERNPRAKLTAAQALEIRAARGRVSQRELARMYGVSKGAIWFIQSGRHWADAC